MRHKVQQHIAAFQQVVRCAEWIDSSRPPDLLDGGLKLSKAFPCVQVPARQEFNTVSDDGVHQLRGGVQERVVCGITHLNATIKPLLDVEHIDEPAARNVDGVQERIDPVCLGCQRVKDTAKPGDTPQSLQREADVFFDLLGDVAFLGILRVSLGHGIGSPESDVCVRSTRAIPDFLCDVGTDA